MSEPISQSSLKIFISYRREDSSGYAGRLYDRLCIQFGADQIFMDIDQMEPGVDFVTVIEDAVGSSDVLLAVIGRRWLTSTEGNTRRLDNPRDFVRLEIVTALNREVPVPVIPILVEGATMPPPSTLPDDMMMLSRRHAFELSDLRWKHDVARLISALEKRAGPPRVKLRDIPSPIVGTFHRAPSPDSDPFVQVGSRVEPDTVVCIIESMKLMNEIQADTSGVVAVIYVENGAEVEWNQPLFGITDQEVTVEPKPAPQPIHPAPQPTPAELSEELEIIKSPIVGTFYRSASPTAESFIRIGSHVERETVVCIIEAMKLMNEIQAEVSGTVEKIYVENGEPVEYGQPLFGIRK